jgi:hypothetical protein
LLCVVMVCKDSGALMSEIRVCGGQFVAFVCDDREV